MRFGDQNKKKIDPRYFLNEQINEQVPSVSSKPKMRKEPGIACRGAFELQKLLVANYPTFKSFMEQNPRIQADPYNVRKKLSDGKVGFYFASAINAFIVKIQEKDSFRQLSLNNDINTGYKFDLTGYKAICRDMADLTIMMQQYQTYQEPAVTATPAQPDPFSDQEVTRLTKSPETPVPPVTLRESVEESYNKIFNEKHKKLFEALVGKTIINEEKLTSQQAAEFRKEVIKIADEMLGATEGTIEGKKVIDSIFNVFASMAEDEEFSPSKHGKMLFDGFVDYIKFLVSEARALGIELTPSAIASGRTAKSIAGAAKEYGKEEIKPLVLFTKQALRDLGVLEEATQKAVPLAVAVAQWIKVIRKAGFALAVLAPTFTLSYIVIKFLIDAQSKIEQTGNDVLGAISATAGAVKNIAETGEKLTDVIKGLTNAGEQWLRRNYPTLLPTELNNCEAFEQQLGVKNQDAELKNDDIVKITNYPRYKPGYYKVIVGSGDEITSLVMVRENVCK